SAFVGWLLYHEQIDIFIAGGAALILAGNLLNLQKKTPQVAEAEAATP
ncbi:MAG: EamA/RhaT family transporter, partial [Mesorhizobium sp.]